MSAQDGDPQDPTSANFRSLNGGYGNPGNRPLQSTPVGAWILPRRNTTERAFLHNSSGNTHGCGFPLSLSNCLTKSR